MNLKVRNEGLSFLFMTAGIMNPMMVMRILDWVWTLQPPGNSTGPLQIKKSPKKYVS
jgi:hypothetical protein